MGGEAVTDSWFSSLWRNPRKSLTSEPEKTIIGVLSFETVSLLSKLVTLWQCLDERHMIRVREDIINSFGIQKLVSEDEDYLMDLVLAEMIETLRYVGKSAAVLGKRCSDPAYHHLEEIFKGSPVEIESNWYRWEYRLKKMERKVKKMERFVAATSQLYQELEVLEELEQTLRRMKSGADIGHLKLFEFRQKVVGQRQEVKNLQEMSPWVRSYDYIVRLVLRSIFTIIGRIQNVFGLNQSGDNEGINDAAHSSHKCLVRSTSISALMQQSSVQPSERYLARLYSGSLGRSFSTLGLIGDKSRYSKKLNLDDKPRVRTVRFGSFRECMSGSDSPIVESCMPSYPQVWKPNGEFHGGNGTNALPTSRSSSVAAKISLLSSRPKLLDAPASTLGHAALALHYANVIILIEKLASSPHLISHDARDDLYHMLPMSVKSSLRAKLKAFKRNLSSSVYDAALAAEWSLALSRILDWLSPLAHNTIRWHSDRNFEKQHLIPGPHVLLVQTLYFANLAKTEAAITELLLGLNYLVRFAQEFNNEQSFLESSCGRSSSSFSVNTTSFAQHNQSHLVGDLSCASASN